MSTFYIYTLHYNHASSLSHHMTVQEE